MLAALRQAREFAQLEGVGVHHAAVFANGQPLASGLQVPQAVFVRFG